MYQTEGRQLGVRQPRATDDLTLTGLQAGLNRRTTSSYTLLDSLPLHTTFNEEFREEVSCGHRGTFSLICWSLSCFKVFFSFWLDLKWTSSFQKLSRLVASHGIRFYHLLFLGWMGLLDNITGPRVCFYQRMIIPALQRWVLLIYWTSCCTKAQIKLFVASFVLADIHEHVQ